MANALEIHARSIAPTIPQTVKIDIDIDTATFPERTQAAVGKQIRAEGLKEQKRITAKGKALALKAEQSQTMAEVNKYKVSVLSAQNELFDKMRDNRDNPTKFEQFREEYTKQVEGFNSILTTPDAKDRGGQWSALQDVAVRGEVALQTDEDSVANAVASYKATAKHAINSNDPELFNDAVDDAITLGVFVTQKQANFVRKEGLRNIQEKIERENKVAADEAEQAAKDVAIGQAFTIYEQAIEAGKTEPEATREALDFVNKADVIPGGEKQEAEQDVIARINYRKAKDTVEKEQARERDRDSINKLMYVDKDYGAASIAIENSTLDEKEQRELLRESNNRAIAAAKAKPKVNIPSAVDNITTAIAQVGNDTLSLAEAKKILRDNQAKLKDEKVIELIEELNKEFDRSTDTAFSRVRSDVRKFAVGRSESLIDRLLGILAQEEDEIKQKTTESRIITEREKFNLELENFNRWEDSMRAWRRQEQNRTASPEAIQKEGIRLWRTDFAGKNINQLREESELETKQFNRIRVRLPDGRIAVGPRNQLEKVKKIFGAVEIGNGK